IPDASPNPVRPMTETMALRLRPVFGIALLLGSAMALSQCGGGSPTAPQQTIETVPVANNPTPITTPTPDPVTETPVQPPVIPPPGSSSTFVNVLGDTGWCGSPALGPLSRLFERFDGDILLAGDLAYPS